MKQHFVDYEINNPNPTFGTVRILAADKIVMERAARARGYELVDGPTTAALMLHAALSRTGVIDNLDFDTFIESVLVDYAPADDEENPTK